MIQPTPLPDIERLAEEVNTLTARVAELRRELDARKDELRRLVGAGRTVQGRRWQVKVGTASPRLRVPRPELVPAAMCATLPDRRAILAHWKATGESVPGTEVGLARPPLRLSRPPGW